MSKIGHTKNKILDMLASNSKTPSEISGELGLNMSTVSQHLKELKEIGAIEELKNEHFKKWKAYRLNPTFDHNGLVADKTAKEIISERGKVLIGIVGIGLIALFLYLLSSRPLAATNSNKVNIALTDPPVVPPGTQALYINYYSVAVHIVGNGTSKWIVMPPEVNASGTINLLSLVNTSQIIGSISIPPDTRVDMVSFEMPSAEIVVNGTEYPLAIRNGQVTSKVIGNKTNSSDSEVLLELDPVVVPMYINGLTVFVMLSQVGCVALNTNSSQGSVGTLSRLSPEELRTLQHIQSNVSMSNTSLTVLNDSISLNVTVTNPSRDTAVVLKDILVLGNQSLINGTERYAPITYVPVTQAHTGVEFLVENDSTLVFANQQYVEPSLVRLNYTYPDISSGLTLEPNQSVTLRFRGQLPLGDNIRIVLNQGSTYKISVLGDLIARLSTNVTSG